ncbi:hypothetical protein LJB42_004589 [Komagataella kurtzmanii]|nr:hypothetical protein LJB42_004589 [Komagataella kurtzmanii]
MSTTDLDTSVHNALPLNLQPTHYDLQIFDIDETNDTFKGLVTIDLDVIQQTDRLVLNVRDIVIDNVQLKFNLTKTVTEVGCTIEPADVVNETVVLKFQETVKSGSLKAVINYSGVIQSNMTGFYKSTYKDLASDETKTMLSTQFEATDARRAFPCLDEPNRKATFQLSIATRANYTVLSNMPVLYCRTLDDGKKFATDSRELKVVQFEKTVVMSTYLLVWAIGEFECLEAFTDRSYNGSKVPIRVYTAIGNKEQGRFALETSTKVVDFFSKIFDIDYPLPKLDLLCVPNFTCNAMENFGLLTFRATALLFDNEKSDPKYKTRVAYVVSHEIAHQWFGNLVTMNWWNELWLNEGFATWVGWLAVDELYPEWNVFSTFVSESYESAKSLDSLRNSHPIEVAINSAKDIDQVFDAISYLKGASVIRMLSQSVGIDVFLKGVSIYLKKHKFGNAKTVDLWSGISEASGIDISKLMDNWIKKQGYPYLKVESAGDNLTITQTRFLAAGDVTPEDDKTIWWVPLNISVGSGTSVAENYALTEKSAVIPRPDSPFFKLNKDSVGVYRVFYSADLLKKISKNLDHFSAEDKVGLLADVNAAAIAGFLPTSKLLEFLLHFKSETDYVVWSEIIKSVEHLNSVWSETSDQRLSDSLTKFCRELFASQSERLGFEPKGNESYFDGQLRPLILLAAGTSGLEPVVSRCLELLENSTAIPPSLKQVVYSTVLSQKNATQEQFDLILQDLYNPSSPDTVETILISLGSVQNDLVIPQAVKLLEDCLTGHGRVALMNVNFLAGSLATNPKTRVLVWNFVKAHYDAIFETMQTSVILFDRFIKTLKEHANISIHNEILEFFSNKNVDGFNRSLQQALDQIKTNYAWIQRDKANITEYLNVE